LDENKFASILGNLNQQKGIVYDYLWRIPCETLTCWVCSLFQIPCLFVAFVGSELEIYRELCKPICKIVWSKYPFFCGNTCESLVVDDICAAVEAISE